jgi:tetratricopeptide (TPR) repeat protein
MEYIEGCNLGELIDSRFPDIRQGLVIMEQVSRALSELHTHGIIHGDLKPENIMISRDKERLHATLIDFSLTKIKHDRRQNDAAGTFCYMSPEKTGMIKRPVDERSDLYALGVIAYRILTRSFPFQDESLTDLLHSQVAVIPDRPSELNPSVPGILDHILMKLLEKDPSRRYQSAGGLIADLEKVRKGVLDFIPGQADRLPDPDYLPQITGRDKELDHLYGAVDALAKSGKVYLLAGQAGVGKTKILETLGHYARKKSCLVLEGRCVQRKNQTPWSLFQELLSDYMKIFSQYPDGEKAAISRAVKKESGDLGSIIIRMFPPAGILLGKCPQLLALDLEKDKLRSFHAVIRFFLALIRAEKKMVMVLEDLQWVDSLSCSILIDLVGALKDSGVMIIGSYRVNDVNRLHPLNELIDTVTGMKNAEVMAIEPLTRQLAGALVKAIVNNKSAPFDRLCDFIFEKSRGNPLYILEVVKNLFHKKVLLRQGTSLVFDEKRLAQTQIPQNLQDIILQRIDRLGETEIGILCDASVLGKRFATSILIELEKSKGISRQSVVSCLDKAHAYWILEKDTGFDTRNFSFAHDRIKDAFYKKIEAEKRAIHNRIGHLIESTYHHSNKKSDLLFDLAHHFMNGENEEKILEYVYPAGLYAMERYDYDLALRYLTIIKTILENHLGSGQAPETRAFWRQCSEKLGEAMIMTGANETGAVLLISLVPFCGNPMEKAALYFQACSAYATRGDWRRCEQHGKAGLALLGISLPIEKNEVKCQIARDLARYFVQAFLPGVLLRQRASGDIARTRLIIMFYQIIAWAMILGDKYKFLHASLRLLWLCEKKRGDLETRCISYGLFVTFCVKNGLWRAADFYMSKAFVLSEKSSHEFSMAQILMINGYFYQFRGDYLKSVEFFTKGVEMFDRIGDMGSSIHCRIGLIDTYVLQGDHDRIEQLLAPYTQMVHKFSDTNGIASVLFKRARLAYEKGNLKEAEKKALECLDFSSTHNSLNNLSWIQALLGAIYLEKTIPTWRWDIYAAAWRCTTKKRFSVNIPYGAFPSTRKP